MPQEFEYWPGDCELGERGACKHCNNPLTPGTRRNCPAKQPPAGLGLGDWVAWLLERVGVTKARYQRWRGKSCGCQARQQRLNRWGNRLRSWWIGARRASSAAADNSIET